MRVSTQKIIRKTLVTITIALIVLSIASSLIGEPPVIQVRCYSGSSLIYEGHALEGRVRHLFGNIHVFTDRESGNLIRTKATCLIEETVRKEP